MDEETFKKKKASGEVEILKPEVSSEPLPIPATSAEETQLFKPEDYVAIFSLLRTLKPTITVAPTFIPKNFLEGIAFYDTGGVRRLYLYVNKNWRYVVLT